jgi:hypothetical protein
MSECTNRHCYSRSDRNIPNLIVVEDKMYVTEFFFVLTAQMLALKLAHVGKHDSLMPRI